MRTLDELLAYENRMSADSKPRKNRFVKYKSWYANEDYMRQIFSYPMLSASNKIHGLYITSALGLMKNFVMGKKARELLPSAADVIQDRHFGDCLRAFYATRHSHRYTLKVVCDSDRRKFMAATKREVALREQLISLNTINIPKVLGTEQRKDAFLLREELIMGRRFHARTDRTLYRESMLPQLRDTYLAYGVRYAPVQTFLPPDKGEEVIGLLAERADAGRFVAALRNVIARNGLAAVSLCHGSLAPGNLAVANGEIVFLDWKRANEGLIIVDLLKTAAKYPKQSYVVEDIREIMTSDFVDDSCQFEELLTAGVALGILRLPSRIPILMHIWRRHAL